MITGRDLWDSAEVVASGADLRSLNAMRFYALAKMVAEAESAWLTGDKAKAVEHIRELQAHSEKMISGLVPEAACKPLLVSSAA